MLYCEALKEIVHSSRNQKGCSYHTYPMKYRTVNDLSFRTHFSRATIFFNKKSYRSELSLRSF